VIEVGPQGNINQCCHESCSSKQLTAIKEFHIEKRKISCRMTAEDLSGVTKEARSRLQPQPQQGFRTPRQNEQG
jgi:hypothetical protein